jgi:hypothetical protein
MRQVNDNIIPVQAAATVTTAAIPALNLFYASAQIAVTGSAATTNMNSVTYAQGARAQIDTGAANLVGAVSWTGVLNVNDVVWAQTDGGANSTTSQSMFTITQVSG